ncbi:MAG TPA: hypothetical protein PKM12_07530 [Marmoricola sp.]|nr:hypothetical protein [Marmoricola sp.]HNN48809.1 hypothetical protein [Marmoricola sp.]
MTRCYVAADQLLLRQLIEQDGISAGTVHGVTSWLRQAWPEGNQEDQEYAALMAAADDSALRIQEYSGAIIGQRVVLVVEVEVLADGQDSTRIQIKFPVQRRQLLAIQADPEPIDLASPDAPELGWYANQEAEQLLDRITRDPST